MTTPAAAPSQGGVPGDQEAVARLWTGRFDSARQVQASLGEEAFRRYPGCDLLIQFEPEHGRWRGAMRPGTFRYHHHIYFSDEQRTSQHGLAWTELPPRRAEEQAPAERTPEGRTPPGTPGGTP